jgi:signal transduction histidine kinase
MKHLLGSLLQLWPAKQLLGVTRVQYALAVPTRSLFEDRALTHSLSSPLTTLFLLLDECIQNPAQLSQARMLKKLLLAREQLESLYATWKDGQISLKTKFSVNSTIRETIIVSGLSHRSQVDLQLQLHKSTRLVGSKILFQQMLSCLLHNAFESYDPLDPYKVIICSAKQTPTHLQLDVIDSGSGMNSLALVIAGIHGFTFKTAGTGVGLTLARRIAQEVFGGTFSITSLPQHGTRVTARLPLNRSVAKPANRLK